MLAALQTPKLHLPHNQHLPGMYLYSSHYSLPAKKMLGLRSIKHCNLPLIASCGEHPRPLQYPPPFYRRRRQRCDDRFVRGRGRQPSKSQSAQKEAIGDALAFASTRSTKRPSQTTEGTTAVAAVAVPVASAYCGARVFNWWHRDQRG